MCTPVGRVRDIVSGTLFCVPRGTIGLRVCTPVDRVRDIVSGTLLRVPRRATGLWVCTPLGRNILFRAQTNEWFLGVYTCGQSQRHCQWNIYFIVRAQKNDWFVGVCTCGQGHYIACLEERLVCGCVHLWTEILLYIACLEERLTCGCVHLWIGTLYCVPRGAIGRWMCTPEAVKTFSIKHHFIIAARQEERL